MFISLTKLVLATVMVVVTTVPGSSSRSTVGPAECAPQSKALSDFEGSLRGMISSRNAESLRQQYNIPQMPADSVHLISDNALCAKAGLLFPPRYGAMANDEHHYIRLARLGKVYWAEDGRKGGEWTLVLILDSTLTQVIGRTAR